jgi:hypothetical protein
MQQVQAKQRQDGHRHHKISNTTASARAHEHGGPVPMLLGVLAYPHSRGVWHESSL